MLLLILHIVVFIIFDNSPLVQRLLKITVNVAYLHLNLCFFKTSCTEVVVVVAIVAVNCYCCCDLINNAKIAIADGIICLHWK